MAVQRPILRSTDVEGLGAGGHGVGLGLPTLAMMSLQHRVAAGSKGHDKPTGAGGGWYLRYGHRVPGQVCHRASRATLELLAGALGSGQLRCRWDSRMKPYRFIRASEAWGATMKR
jgi:hypothetical protein